jgi:cytochrome oxidase Cu insertion factor (SCO1/SenC/PrrC family)
LPADARRRFLLTALLCLVLGGLAGLLVATLREPDLGLAETFRPPQEPPPSFKLRDQTGRVATPADAKGDVLLLTFFFSTCRTSCPQQGLTMASALDGIGSGVQTMIISVDPVGDTRKNIASFLERTGLQGARYLVGTREELEPVWRDYGVAPLAADPERAAGSAARFSPDQVVPGDAEEATRRGPPVIPGPPAPDKPEFKTPPPAAGDAFPEGDDLRYRGRRRHGFSDFEHTAYLLLIDRQGRQRVGFPFEQLDDEMLRRDIRLLLRERV